MDEKYKHSRIISEARDYAFQILEDNSDINVYTNISLVFRIEKNIKVIISEDNIEGFNYDGAFLASYFFTISHVLNPSYGENFEHEVPVYDNIISDFQNHVKIPEDTIASAKAIVDELFPGKPKTIVEAKVLGDAVTMDFACDKGRDRLKLLYEQMILHDVEISKSSWFDIIIPMMKRNEVHTDYGKRSVAPRIEKLIKQLKKERKEIEATKDLVLQKELNISDEEIKSLKKGLIKIKGRDDRGIQTLFRTTSKNHYTLNQMVDGKASIMITVNSILLSLALGGVLGKFDEGFPNNIPTLVFSISNVISIIFAILSITPNKTHGNFTENEIRAKKGNLLYYGNFFKMHYRDFEWAFLQILQDKDYLYTSMIRDYYHQAQVLHKKSTSIRVSLVTFLVGIALTVLTKVVLEMCL